MRTAESPARGGWGGDGQALEPAPQYPMAFDQ